VIFEEKKVEMSSRKKIQQKTRETLLAFGFSQFLMYNTLQQIPDCC